MLPTQATQLSPGRIGNYQHTSTGAKYYPFDPRADEVDQVMVAHHLATNCRFNGAVQHKIHTDRIFYSVAEHSVYVSLYIEFVLGLPEYALEGLLHDSSEFSIGDLIRPLKYSPEFRQPFKLVEERIEASHAEAFNLVYPYPDCVKIADEAVCTAEINQIVPRSPGEDFETVKLHDDTNVAPYHIEMVAPYQAKLVFLARFKELAMVRHKYRALPSRFLL